MVKSLVTLNGSILLAVKANAVVKGRLEGLCQKKTE